MKGKLLRIIAIDNIFMLEFFRLFRIGIAWMDDTTGKASALILGIWKFEINITLAMRNKIEWHEIGEA